MEYLKIEGEFPKLANCAVTMGKFDGVLLASDFDNTLVYTEGALARGDLAVKMRRKTGFGGGDVAACRHCGEGPGGRAGAKLRRSACRDHRRGGRPRGATGPGVTGQGEGGARGA